MSAQALIILIALGLALLTLAVFWLLRWGLRATRRILEEIAPADATPTRLPLGVVFEVAGHPARLYALQGSFVFSASIPLTRNPRLLLTRTMRGLAVLDFLHWSPWRRRVPVNARFDETYGSRAGEPDALRELLSPELQRALLETGRVQRLSVNARRLSGSFFVLRHTSQELALAAASVAVLISCAEQLAASSLAQRGR